tara:strand:- start:402 stop:743 length:342 start_codon:yes stop_codon:yes gene_type:complete
MALDYVALGIMILLVLLGVVIALKLGALPGKIAEQRGHPQVDAIRVCGWIGLITAGLVWPVAFIWAYTVPSGLKPKSEEAEIQDNVTVEEPEAEEPSGEDSKNEKIQEEGATS